MKLFAVLAVASTATALQIRDAIPNAALQLKGDALRDYVNSAQSLWKAATPTVSRRNNLMAIKHTKQAVGVTYKASIAPEVAAAIPDSFDARQQWPNCVSIGSVRDQSDCGSCWAFGAAEAMSDRVCIATNGAQKPTLAAADVLSCCGSYCGYGCEGGYPIRAWNWWVSDGLCTGGGFYENDGCKPYPIEPCGTHTVANQTHYHDCSTEPEPDTPRCTAKCTNSNYQTDYKKDKFFGKSAYAIRNRVADIQQEIIDHGPVEAAFTVYADFEQYTGGIYQHTAGSVLGGHAVKILGWGVEKGTPYWIVANSWNTNWGENGFFRIIRGKNDCGMEEAIVAGLPKV